MRTSPSLPSTGSLGLALRRAGSVLREAVLLAGTISLVEAAAPVARHDGIDLIVVLGVLLLGTLLKQAADAGWMPATRHLAGTARARLRSLGKGLLPRYAVAFRPNPEAASMPDGTLQRPAFGLLVALTLATAAAPWLHEGLLWLRAHVAYTLYLVGLATFWTVFFLTTLLGCVACAQGLHAAARRLGGPFLPFLAFGVLWIGGLLGLAFVPGWVPLLLVLVGGWWTGRSLRRVPIQGYVFCRRDEQGRPRTIPVHVCLQRLHTVVVLALAVVVVLAQGPRLWFATWPEAPLAFTGWVGLLTTLCALALVARAGAHFRGLLGGGRVPPEVPLTPTLWIRRSPLREMGGVEEQREAWWRDVAREAGWLVLCDVREPPHAYDLVMGEERDARRFVPREPIDEEDARFQLARRFHVVMRRQFHRDFERLVKRLRAETPEAGTGWVFCPHVWLVPGVTRDADPRQRRDGGATVNPAYYGPPYDRVFGERVRRYVGAVLRSLQVDLVFFEDVVTWRDLRRVLTVAYEIHDQGRGPIQERHFVGIPRVRVVIQEEAAEPEAPPGTAPVDPATPGAGYARILLILRDRGARDDAPTRDPVDTGIRTPSLVP